jgi:hypothetical protein
MYQLCPDTFLFTSAEAIDVPARLGEPELMYHNQMIISNLI